MAQNTNAFAKEVSVPNKKDNDQENSLFDNIPSPFRRTSSLAMGKRDLWIIIVNKNGEEILLDYVDFADIEPLGSGRQGNVYAAKVIFKNDDDESEARYCVLKNIHRKRYIRQSPFAAHEKISEKDESSIQNNTIKLIKLIEHDDNCYALLPYCSLFLDSAIEFLKNASKTDPAQLQKIKLSLAFHTLRDVCIAFNSMHFAKEFVHGDVKPANVGLYCGHWCLVDMECAMRIGAPVNQLASTLLYTSHAALHNRDNAANPSNDFYALGRMVRDILHPEEYGVHGDMRSVLEKRNAEYREALYEKYFGNAKAKKTLLEMVKAGKLAENLELLSTGLMSKLETDQPDAIQIEECIFGQLEKQLSTEIPDFTEILEDFYGQLKTDGYFHADSSDPLSSPKKYPARLSLSSSSLFSASATSSRTSDWSEASQSGRKKNVLEQTENDDDDKKDTKSF